MKFLSCVAFRYDGTILRLEGEVITMRASYLVIGVVGLSLVSAEAQNRSPMTVRATAQSQSRAVAPAGSTASSNPGVNRSSRTWSLNQNSPSYSNCNWNRSNSCYKPCKQSCWYGGVYYGWPGYYYGWPTYYSSGSVNYVYGGTYSFSSGPAVVDSAATYNDRNLQSVQQPQSSEQQSWLLGRDWGQDLRRDVVTFDQFIAFVAERIAGAPELLLHRFREGFETGYGQHAYEAFQKALDAARQGNRAGTGSSY